MRSNLIIEGREVVAIIDSGAAGSLISNKLRKDLGITIQEESNARFIMADGSRVASLGKTELEIELDDETGIKIPVQVIDSSVKDLIIGNDVIGERKGIIDYEMGILSIENGGKFVEIPVEYYRGGQNISYEKDDEYD